jgi:tetratricopeptide (TPR) repeat protein
VEITPDNAEAHRGEVWATPCATLGSLLTRQPVTAGRWRSTTMWPKCEVYGDLGAVLQCLQQYDDAVQACDRALEIKPDFAEAHGNRAIVNFHPNSTLRALGNS